MSNFWQQRIGGQQQPAPPPPPASNKPWWMPQDAPQPAPQQAAPQPQQQVQPPSVRPDGKVAFSDLLMQDEYTTTKAQSAKDTQRCPECDGPNYVAEKGNPQSMKHCFDCGYNPRFSQTMSGVSGIGQNVPVKTSRVQNPSIGAPPMGTVIGHI